MARNPWEDLVSDLIEPTKDVGAGWVVLRGQRANIRIRIGRLVEGSLDTGSLRHGLLTLCWKMVLFFLKIHESRS